ncbi:DDE-domain-containing protein, partial [Zopfia rhizophila CBS 207.26]
MSRLGFPVRVKFIPFLAYRLTLHRPESARPTKPPHRNWTLSFRKRHPQIEARIVRALDWNRHDKNIYPKITHWFEVIGEVLRDPEILAGNVYNMDETGVMPPMLDSVKVLVGKDDSRKYRGARVKRTTITAIECISGDGRYLNPMIIWPANTHRNNWTTLSTPGWQYACSESGYTDSYISLQWLKRIFDPETKERADGKPRVLICDGFGSHETLEVLEFCLENKIILCRLASHTSHKTQPCDVSVFGPLKSAYREEVERLERGGVNAIGKEHFTSLYSRARSRAFTPRNIRAGFSACGLFPFNPDRVLRGIPKPPDESTISVSQGMPGSAS